MKDFATLMKDQWQDGISTLLGVWLLFSPWILQFDGNNLAMWNSVILGAIITVASVSALVQFHEWEEWADVAMGLWLAASPWLLGYTATMAAMWNHLAVGLLVMVVAALGIWHFRHHPTATG